MKGDFSKWYYETKGNFNGVLHQQGKVLLDTDWNDEVVLKSNWQSQVIQDVVGPGVAAVSSLEYDNFKVKNIEKKDGEVIVTVSPGRLWADGFLLYLNELSNSDPKRITPPIYDTELIKRRATPLEYIEVEEDNHASPKTLIFLEIWQDIVNGFQEHEILIEPALNGIDTTERMRTMFSFKYKEVKLDSIRCRKFDYIPKGKLSVSYESATTTDKPCPKLVSGGYTGLEHRFYRIEIAETTKEDGPYFKWSRNNGSLVGRGTYNKDADEVKIKANLQSILYSDYTTSDKSGDFYMEIIRFDKNLGIYVPTYGAKVSLIDRKSLRVIEKFLNPDTMESGVDVFFRLWNGIRKVTSFTSDDSLEDGICLNFDSTDKKFYRPGDFWTFPVRADVSSIDMDNDNNIFKDMEPFGINYHLIPLAIKDSNDIMDCRVPFRPLIFQKNCGFYTVGDGNESHGDFDSIEEAYDNLPESGGILKILPGDYRTNLLIQKDNVEIIGCGERSCIKNKEEDPVIYLLDSKNSSIKNLKIEGIKSIGIKISGITTENIQICNNIINSTDTPIEINQGAHFYVHNNTIELTPKILNSGGVPYQYTRGIYIKAKDCVIEKNKIYERFNHYKGGIQISGGSERIIIIDNHIEGGKGCGITLGNGYFTRDLEKLAQQASQNPKKLLQWSIQDRFPFLYDIHILNNTITKMGSSGIGMADFFFFGTRTNKIKIEMIKASFGIFWGLPHIQFSPFFPIIQPIIDAEKLFQKYFDPPLSYGNKIEDITIKHNTISNCLQDFKDIKALQADQIYNFELIMRDKAFGGISLLCCQNPTIQGNHIENNGIMPVCGIYIKYGEEIDISNNTIINNSSFVNKGLINLRSYRTGGIIIEHALSLAYLNMIPKPDAEISPNILNKQAARINNNVVHPNYGQALAINANGPLSITNNSFRSPCSSLHSIANIKNLPDGYHSIFSGAISIVNTGGLDKFVKWMLIDGDLIRSKAIAGFPSGLTIFNNNQTYLGDNICLWSQFITSFDDIEFTGNQSETGNLKTVFSGTGSELMNGLVGNTYLKSGITVRASNNRLTEFNLENYPIDNVVLIQMQLAGELWWNSLLTRSLFMNNTHHNQGDHCINAKCDNLGGNIKIDDQGNQMLTCYQSNPIEISNKMEFLIKRI